MERLSARLTRQSGTNFYYAFRILPRDKREAIYAVYSFCRVVDDCVDEPDGEGEAGLVRWLAEAHRCYAGEPQTELGRELAQAVNRFPIPRGCFEDIVAGCRMDLNAIRYPSFADLRLYCERVASAVGLASIEVFGYRDPATRDYAINLGLALQLTNILRDVTSDAALGRLYFPLDDLARFDVSEEEMMAAAKAGGQPPPAVRRLLAFEAGRAREHYERAATLLPCSDRRAMAPAEVMGAVYRAILDEIEARGYPLGPPVRIPRPRKAWIALRALARAYLVSA
ncbi:MAG TPA: presqualene diphosphate synthase HpnD [Vicinamibacteria bacterium]|nr:presqualene diphosphate synthase HpnD [Vicinamibacteria bacterium]